MELSSEDNLRLNVLISQTLYAVRIDESSMVVHALSEQGEAKVSLNPTCRDDKYLRLVRELLSMHALGSPGGYPVFLKRWTRMGQMREQSLDGLLLLGEPEAIVAVAHAPDLDEKNARRAWWAMPSADVARRMLENRRIAESEFGKELAAFLIDYLPFERVPQAIVESVKLVLQPGLIDAATVNHLWRRAERKSVYYVGFLHAVPDQLPVDYSPHDDFQQIHNHLQKLLQQQNPFAKQLVRLLSPAGQAFLHTLENVLLKLNSQDVVVLLLASIEAYSHTVRVDGDKACRHIEHIVSNTDKRILSANEPLLAALVDTLPDEQVTIKAMLALSLVGEELINPIFSQTDAQGSVMRNKLMPITVPLREWIQQLKTHRARGS